MTAKIVNDDTSLTIAGVPVTRNGFNVDFVRKITRFHSQM